jgi:hypothetical protein
MVGKSSNNINSDHEHVHDHVNVHVDVHVLVDVVGFPSRGRDHGCTPRKPPGIVFIKLRT